MLAEWITALWLRIKALVRRRQLDRDLSDELQFHLAMREKKLREQGVAAEEAHYAARRNFGNAVQAKEANRELWTFPILETLGQDLRYGLRQLRGNPGFTAVAVITLALGIGANVAIFGLVNAVLLRPLPYPNPGRLMHVDWLFKNGDVPSVTGEEYVFWREHSRVFQSTAAYGLFPKGFNLLAGTEPEHVKAWEVSHDFFRTFGVQPFLGRSFTPEEDRPGGTRTVVLSYGLWKQRFGAQRSIVGRSVILDGQSYSVVGVMPKGFRFSLPYAPVGNIQAWVPLRLVPNPNEDGHDYLMVARLKPNVSQAQARADMSHVLAEIRQAVPGYVHPRERGAVLIPYRKWATGDVRGPLLILLVAVGFVFLIATANVASLSIARATTRRTEMAVRLALGASPGRVRWQLVTESLLVALAGGAAALIVGPWVAKLLLAISPEGLPLAGGVHVDFRVLLFALSIAAIAGIAAGLAPAFRLRRFEVGPALKEGGRTSSAGSSREHLRRWLVGGEIALSTLLLSGALLLMFSLIALGRTKPGFNPQDLWSFHISLNPAVSKTASATSDFEQRVLARLKELPGARSASVASSLPLEPSLNFGVKLTTGDRESHVYVDARSVSPGYFQTMEMPILRGRAFDESDTATSSFVVIVNRAFAQQCCRGRSALGSLVYLPMGSNENIAREIVGIVGDTKEDALNEPSPPTVFIPQAQLDDELTRAIYIGSSSSWVVRTSARPDLAEIQHAVSQVDRGEAVTDLQPMGKVIAESLAPGRFEAVLMAVFAGLALVLAAVGLYGVTSYLVAERTHEIGIRMALGAQKTDVLRLVVGKGMGLALAGVGVGIALALGLMRFLSSLLYGITPTDPLTFIVVSLILIAVALLACYIPARRATKVDPMVALRHE